MKFINGTCFSTRIQKSCFQTNKIRVLSSQKVFGIRWLKLNCELFDLVGCTPIKQILIVPAHYNNTYLLTLLSSIHTLDCQHVQVVS